MKRLLIIAALAAGLGACEQGWQDERGYHRGREPANDNRTYKLVTFISVLTSCAVAGSVAAYITRK